MSKELHTKILGDLKARAVWEEKQRIWGEMRSQGLRRKNKPFVGASDLHFPLGDTIIEKTKPFYAQQLVSVEMLASFVSKSEQSAELTTAAARWLDYEMRNQSDFVTETMFVVDHMLQSDHGILKIFWDREKDRLGFDALEPTQVIVPANTKALADADRVTVVLRMSVEQYERNERYNQDKTFVKRITGGTSPTNQWDVGGIASAASDSDTKDSEDGEIVIWEVYVSQKDGPPEVHTFSPMSPDDPVRDPFRLSYSHGKIPLVKFDMEMKGKGYFDARGIMQIIAPFETASCKAWNEHVDFMTYVCRPIFSADRQVPNIAQIKVRPGEVFPFGLTRVDLGHPPMEFHNEVEFNRGIAEQRIGSPDNGLQQQNGRGKSDARTATEIEQVGQVNMQSTSLRAILFRLQLTQVFEQAWSLITQFRPQEVQFMFDNAMQSLPPNARQTKYIISPSGNVDSWNRTQQLQRATVRFQMFKGDPFINQGELRKSVLVLDDPQLVRTLFQDPKIEAASQYEDQAHDINAMLIGFPVIVEESDDHASRILCTAQFMQKRALHGQPLDPEQEQLLRANMQQHGQALAQQGPQGKQALQQVNAQVQQVFAQTHQAAQQQAMQAQQQQNVVPMQAQSAAGQV